MCIYVYYVYIYIYIPLYQSEGFPRTGYFIPAHVGTGAGPDLSSFRRRRPAYFLANLAHVWQSTFLFTIGHQKRDLSAPLLGDCSELCSASFSKKCKF